MLDLFRENPWLLVVMMGMLIPIAGIVFGTTTGYLTRVRRAGSELEGADAAARHVGRGNQDGHRSHVAPQGTKVYAGIGGAAARTGIAIDVGMPVALLAPRLL